MASVSTSIRVIIDFFIVFIFRFNFWGRLLHPKTVSPLFASRDVPFWIFLSTFVHLLSCEGFWAESFRWYPLAFRPVFLVHPAADPLCVLIKKLCILKKLCREMCRDVLLLI
jgi:hypothetical protein